MCVCTKNGHLFFKQYFGSRAQPAVRGITAAGGGIRATATQQVQRMVHLYYKLLQIGMFHLSFFLSFFILFYFYFILFFPDFLCSRCVRLYMVRGILLSKLRVYTSENTLCVEGRWDSHVLRTVCRIGTIPIGPEQTIHDVKYVPRRWDRNRCFFSLSFLGSPVEWHLFRRVQCRQIFRNFAQNAVPAPEDEMRRCRIRISSPVERHESYTSVCNYYIIHYRYRYDNVIIIPERRYNII